MYNLRDVRSLRDREYMYDFRKPDTIHICFLQIR